MIKNIQLIVENTFVHSSASDDDSGITVYDRVFNKLVNEGGTLGKIQPIYLKTGNSYKVFGIITLNKSGSFSFFPELPGVPDFDHITFVKNLLKNNHHYTKNTVNGREKVLPIHAEYLSNKMYHGLTLIIGNVSFLKEAPKKIVYPKIDAKHLNKLQDAFSTSGKLEGSTILKIDGEGTICIQFFLIPKETDYNKMEFYIKPIKHFIPDLNMESENGSPVFNAIIPHEYQKEYTLGVKVILLRNNVHSSLLVITTTITKGYYCKIDVAGLKKTKIN